MFSDEVKINVIAGKGGDGAVSFRREKFVPRGGPDGGDGGHGGSVMFKVNTNLNTLSNITSGKTYKGLDGVGGQRKNMHGKNAETVTLEVPQGTIIYNEDKSEILADLNDEEDEYIAVKGGKGGLGNARFASSTHQAPKFAENGEPGEKKELKLELKLVAEIGLIGLPSAGKSTLISVISNAKPKIAAYHFTTLIPNLGVVSMAKFGGSATESFVAADIPGLIEGASQGKGLGHQFLRHISRTKLLLHVIDGTLENIEEDFKTINKELADFDKELANKEQIIVLNKIDMLTDDEVKTLSKLLKKIGKNKAIFPISGITKAGLAPLMFAVYEKLMEIKKSQPKEKKKKELPVLQPHLNELKFEIEKIVQKKDHKVFRIIGKRIEQLITMTDTKNIEGLERVYHFMEKMGIKKAIEKRGAKFGDQIKILDRSIPYRK